MGRDPGGNKGTTCVQRVLANGVMGIVARWLGVLRSPCGEGLVASWGDREVGAGQGSMESGYCLLTSLQTSLSPIYDLNKIINAED